MSDDRWDWESICPDENLAVWIRAHLRETNLECGPVAAGQCAQLARKIFQVIAKGESEA